MKIKKNGKVINLTESDLKKITESVLNEGTVFVKVHMEGILKSVDPKNPEQFKKNEDGSYTLTSPKGSMNISQLKG